ncbi:MAG: oxaloacetate decarboxylase [Acidobacteriota bacterium]|nr:oxaloacetate decarboxylase [Acidobacteriota bacterium]
MSAGLLPGGGPPPRRTLRQLLAADEPVLAPGAYDALSARLVAEAGFPAVYMTGFGAAASLLGRPDVGLLTMTEMVDQARRMVDAVGVPVIADADTGYGNPLNVLRTVRAFEQAGVAAVQLEDQVTPKRCGHMEGKQVIPADDMVAKVRAAVAARTDPDLVLVARTDAGATEGLEAAVSRARRYHEAGADVLFVEAPQTEAEVEAVAEQLAGVPLLFNWAEGGRTPPMPLDLLRDLGFRVVIFPVSTLLAATWALREVLAAVRRGGTPALSMDRLVPFGEFLDFIGLPEVGELESRFA